MKALSIFLLTAAFFLTNTFITLDDLKWKKRVLLCFVSPSDESAFMLEINDSIEQAMNERDLVYFLISDSIASNSGYFFDEKYVEEIRKMYSLGSKSHCWALLGKDGSLKLRKEGESPQWEELFTTIDAMPMRQKEIKIRQEGDI